MFLDKICFCILVLCNQTHLKTKRASSCASRRNARSKGSITVEAAFAIPFFFLAVLCIVYMLEVMAIRTSIRSGIQCVAKSVAEKAYTKSIVSVDTLENDIVQIIGKGRLDQSVVVGGSNGLHCEASKLSAITGIFNIKVTYEVRLPVPQISDLTVPMEESMRVKGWNGYVKAGFANDTEEIVYVTENGMVYHKDYNCTYLDLSVRMVDSEELDTIRNESMGIYHACEKCVHGGAKSSVYVTDYGDRYHNSLTCSGLKRTIYAIPLEEAIGKGACSKCAR